MSMKMMMLAGLVASTAEAQVPAPPLLPGQTAIARELAGAISRKDAARYAALLADDVSVYRDGKLIAHSKSEWMAKFGEKLKARGVSFKVSASYASTGRLLFIEYFNSAASWGGGGPVHCCWSTDAVAYDLRDGKIVRIRQLSGGEVLPLTDPGAPTDQ